MSLTTLCGRCFATNCSTGQSTSWWLDHSHPRSRLLSWTCSTSMESRRQLQENAVWTRPKSSECASPICWRSSIVRSRESGLIVLQPRACPGSLFDMAPSVEFARAGAQRTYFYCGSCRVRVSATLQVFTPELFLMAPLVDWESLEMFMMYWVFLELIVLSRFWCRGGRLVANGR